METSDERREEARRFAKLLVSEIKLYNEKQVQAGRQQGNLYELLKEDIDRSRQASEATRAQVFSDVDSAHAQVESNIALLKPYKAKYRDQATRVRDTITYSYEHGGASLLDMLNDPAPAAQRQKRSRKVFVPLVLGNTQRRQRIRHYLNRIRLRILEPAEFLRQSPLPRFG